MPGSQKQWQNNGGKLYELHTKRYMNKEEKPETLGDALPNEISRVNDLIVEYKSVGPPGYFAASMMKASVDNAVRALASGDVIEMIRAYEDLKSYN